MSYSPYRQCQEAAVAHPVVRALCRSLVFGYRVSRFQILGTLATGQVLARTGLTPPSLMSHDARRYGRRFLCCQPCAQAGPAALRSAYAGTPAACADIFMAEDYEPDDLVDVIEGRCVYVPAIYVVNKIDQVSTRQGWAVSLYFPHELMHEPCELIFTKYRLFLD